MKRVTRFMTLALLLLCGELVTAQEYQISDIFITGNSVTKEKTILREVPLYKGDILSSSDLKDKLIKAKQNLMNTSLFNYVTVTCTIDTLQEAGEAKRVTVKVEVEERWYLWPLVEVRLEDRNLSSWIKNSNWKNITYKLGATYSNAFGVGQKLAVTGSWGYESGVKIAYTKIALNKEMTSYLGFDVEASYNKRIDCITQDNKPQQLSGSDINKKSYSISGTYTYRPHIRTLQELNITYDLTTLNKAVRVFNPNYWAIEGDVARTLSVEYSFLRNQRDYSVYPVEGFYFSLSGKMAESNEFDFVYGNFLFDYQRYWKFADRWFWSSAIKISGSAKNHRAYIFDRAIGYDNINITGYELYVIDGQHFFTNNNSLKFLLLKPKVVHLNFIPTLNKINKPFFMIYAKATFDIGYAWQKYKSDSNTYSNKFLCGAGVGIDVITYYDIVLNIGYSVNNQGKGSLVFGFKTPLF